MNSNNSAAILKVCINLIDKELCLYQDDQLVRHYPILDTKEGLPTGKFAVWEKIYNPPIGLGSRWIGLDRLSLGIHGVSLDGNPEPCQGIRLDNDHLEDLFALVPSGSLVEISKAAYEFSTLALPNQFGRFPATPSAFPVVPGPCSYIIQRGDTIWKLSKRFNIPMEKILAANLLPNPNRLEPGQIINIPFVWPYSN